MSNQITVTGNLAADPELRFTNSGAAVVEFVVLQTPRHFDRLTNEWKDGVPNRFRVKAWRNLAENIAESAQSGDPVTVTGAFKTEKWSDRETSENRYAMHIEAEDVAISLKNRTASPKRVNRSTPADTTAPSDPFTN